MSVDGPCLSSLRGRTGPLLLACCAWALSACSTSGSLGYRAPSLDTRPPANAVALLPVDVGVVLDGMGDIEREELEKLRVEVVASTTALVQQALARNGYEVTAALDWDGNGAVDPEVIGSVVDGLLTHANGMARGGEGGGSIDPEQTRYLGAATGARALLYVNGRAVANTNAKKVWQGVLVGVVVLAAVASVFAIATAGDGGSGRRGSRHGHHHHDGGGVVVVGGPVIFVEHSGRRGPPPDEYQEPGFFDGDKVRLMATLVDVRSGEILWHADLADGLDPRDGEELSELVSSLLVTLPTPAKPAPAR